MFSVPCIVISPDAAKAAKHAPSGLHLLTVVGSPACTVVLFYMRQPRQEMSPVRRLTANECDRDMPHRRVALGAMPMAFTGLDVHDVAHIDLTLFMLRRHHAGARGDDQDLVARMRMPTRGATLAEVHYAAIIVRGVPRLNDGLT
jgi:hypothetical protein